MVAPLPRVIYPMISSPGIGLQHFAMVVAIPFNPITLMASEGTTDGGASTKSNSSSGSSSSFSISSSLLITLPEPISPQPMATYKSSTVLILSSGSISSRSTDLRPSRLNSFSRMAFPWVRLDSRSCLLNHCLIFERARLVRTRPKLGFNQSREGPPRLAVKISTWFPVSNT